MSAASTGRLRRSATMALPPPEFRALYDLTVRVARRIAIEDAEIDSREEKAS